MHVVAATDLRLDVNVADYAILAVYFIVVLDKAAGVRINLWTGLGMLALGLAFLAWALLRPLTIETMVEGQAESADAELEHEELGEERRRVRPPAH